MLGAALTTTTATCQLCQQSRQVSRVEFLVFGFVRSPFSTPVEWDVCAQLYAELPGPSCRGRIF